MVFSVFSVFHTLSVYVGRTLGKRWGNKGLFHTPGLWTTYQIPHFSRRACAKHLDKYIISRFHIITLEINGFSMIQEWELLKSDVNS